MFLFYATDGSTEFFIVSVVMLNAVMVSVVMLTVVVPRHSKAYPAFVLQFWNIQKIFLS
jgi:hypothetical protein